MVLVYKANDNLAAINLGQSWQLEVSPRHGGMANLRAIFLGEPMGLHHIVAYGEKEIVDQIFTEITENWGVYGKKGCLYNVQNAIKRIDAARLSDTRITEVVNAP